MHSEGTRRIDDGAARTVRGAWMAVTAAKATAAAASIPPLVRDAVKCAMVCFHNVNLIAANATDAIGIAIVQAARAIRARAHLSVGLHLRRVNRKIATTARS